MKYSVKGYEPKIIWVKQMVFTYIELTIYIEKFTKELLKAFFIFEHV